MIIPGYENVDIASLGKVRVMDSMGVLRGGFLLLDPKDRMGLSTVYSPADSIMLKVHPKRIQPDDINGSMAVVDKGKAIAVCPTCGKVCAVKNDAGECDCGSKFDIAGTIESQSSPQPVKKKIASESVDLGAIAAQGEMWICKGVKFDDGKTSVTAISFRAGDRYLSFNLYNGSFGKKGTQPPIANLVAGMEVGYKIDDVDKWRKKLTKKGYVVYTP